MNVSLTFNLIISSGYIPCNVLGKVVFFSLDAMVNLVVFHCLHQVGIGLNVQPSGLAAATSVQQQLQAPMHKQPQHQLLPPSTGAKETG